MLEHGGRLAAAALRYGIAPADWLDLSTGINPHGYPVPPLDPELWRRLPEDDDGLIEAARSYYGHAQPLPLPGSQAAIQALPFLRAPGRVAILTPSYAEYAHWWARAQHDVAPVALADLEAAAENSDAIITCNPNNPDAECIEPQRLLALARKLAEHGGWLVVDEAFADTTPDLSVTPQAGDGDFPNLIVLRSLGKFFGLAGARVGFAFANAEITEQLREAIGPWAVSTPARAAARMALADAAWQAQTRIGLAQAGTRLSQLLSPLGPVRALPLFSYLHCAAAEDLANFLARRAILVRRFAHPSALRFALPSEEAEWARLATALSTWREP